MLTHSYLRCRIRNRPLNKKECRLEPHWLSLKLQTTSAQEETISFYKREHHTGDMAYRQYEQMTYPGQRIQVDVKAYGWLGPSFQQQARSAHGTEIAESARSKLSTEHPANIGSRLGGTPMERYYNILAVAFVRGMAQQGELVLPAEQLACPLEALTSR